MLSGAVASSLAVAAVGGVLSVDRTAAFQTMVSRPLVAAPVIGYLLGNVDAALMVGVVLELLLIGDLPVGRYIPVHETGVAVLVTAATVTALPGSSDASRILPVALLCVMPVSLFYHKADTLVRRVNARFFDNAVACLENGAEISLVLENLKGSAVFFAAGFVTLFVTALPVIELAGFFGHAALNLNLYPAFAGCLILGVAAGLNAVYTDRTLLIFSAAAVAAAAAFMVGL